MKNSKKVLIGVIIFFIIIAIVVNSIFVYVILKSSNRIERLLGNNGIAIIRRVFGIILLSISVKLFSTNISLIV